MLEVKKPRQCRGFIGGRLRRSDRSYFHGLAVQRTLGAEGHFAVDQREQRVILARADVGASVEFGAALTHDDRAGRHDLAAEHLHAEHLRLGSTAVPRGTAALFLCHGSDSLTASRAQALTALISSSVKAWR